MPDGGFLKALRDDALNGTLPQVSWIVAPANYSEHPGPSSPVQGAWYIQETLDALTANPDVWSKTVLLINFDENDGYFDHVPPPAAPSLDTADGTLPAGAVSGALAGASTVNTDLDRHTRPSQQDPADHRVYGPPARADVCGLALEPRRLGQLAVLRPHLGAALPGSALQDQGREHQPVAPRGAGRPDLGLQLRHAQQ